MTYGFTRNFWTICESDFQTYFWLKNNLPLTIHNYDVTEGFELLRVMFNITIWENDVPNNVWVLKKYFCKYVRFLGKFWNIKRVMFHITFGSKTITCGRTYGFTGGFGKCGEMMFQITFGSLKNTFGSICGSSGDFFLNIW